MHVLNACSARVHVCGRGGGGGGGGGREGANAALKHGSSNMAVLQMWDGPGHEERDRRSKLPAAVGVDLVGEGLAQRVQQHHRHLHILPRRQVCRIRWQCPLSAVVRCIAPTHTWNQTEYGRDTVLALKTNTQ